MCRSYGTSERRLTLDSWYAESGHPASALRKNASGSPGYSRGMTAQHPDETSDDRRVELETLKLRLEVCVPGSPGHEELCKEIQELEARVDFHDLIDQPEHRFDGSHGRSWLHGGS